ncbi:uncharacterized protein EV420DRAFT_1638880 [Desarmillaria tabescens]|uniref:Brain protein I3 n=1 Tax=Armillaria tabescens TaxID=1929756 RepID=A0AA39TM83_ARMTA|nr:uncharacterized protein EV420DRAFT_1638880 [Desarmillaria tabescens]KAK0463962.1 hypothetical protein EV420DRAFT_1638880 [Desarmillaria tabescens]
MSEPKAPLQPEPQYQHPSQPPPEYGRGMYPGQPQPPPPQQQSYNMHPPQQPPPQAPPKTPAQIGEEYRSALYAQCAAGVHEPTTKFGICGIITAVVCFPIGLICLFMDTEQKCNRCGIKLR